MTDQSDEARAANLVTAWCVASDAIDGAGRFRLSAESASRLEARVSEAFAAVRADALERAVLWCERQARAYACAASEANSPEDEIAASVMSVAAKKIRALKGSHGR